MSIIIIIIFYKLLFIGIKYQTIRFQTHVLLSVF